MKKTLLAILIGTTILSCKKNDTSSSPILGVWKSGSFYINVFTSGGSTTFDTVSIPPNRYIMEFTSNGKLYENGDTSNYSINGNMLILDRVGTGYANSNIIEKLDANNLTLLYSWSTSSVKRRISFTR